MLSVKAGEDIYNVDKYTDMELYHILDLSNPSDRELEARLFHLIKKYRTMDNESGNKLAKFFEDIYERFFEIEEAFQEAVDTGDQSLTITAAPGAAAGAADPQAKSASTAVSQLDYSKDFMNPLLKQTITRVISIDSQFRNNKKTTLSTNFSFNLSDTLRDVVSMRMNSIHIPKTWYTVSKSYGSNFLYIKGNSPGVNDGLHDYQIAIPAGNYNQADIIAEVNNSIEKLKLNNTDVNFGNTTISYNTNTCKATFTIFVKSIYNETDYNLNFDYFTYPKDSDANGVYNSIPALLGFNDQNFHLGTVHSVKDLSGTGHPTTDISSNGTYLGYTDNSDMFYLTSYNNHFHVINYDGYYGNNWITYGDASFNDASYNSIKITSSLKTDMSYSRLELVTDFSAQIHKSAYLSKNICGIQRFYVDNVDHVSYNYSFFNFKLNLNKKTTTNAVNQKTVMLVVNDPVVWVGPTSCFHLDLSVNEISTIKASSEYSRSDYTVGNNVYFIAECDASGYYHSIGVNRDFSMNDVTVNITPGNYILSDYLNEINFAIRRADISNNHIFDPLYNPTSVVSNITGFSINNSSGYNLRMRYYMKKEFTVDAYVIRIASTDFFSTSLAFNSQTYTNYDISYNTRGICDISGSTVQSVGSNYSLIKNDILFTIGPNKTRATPFGNNYADPYVVRYTGNTINGLNVEEVKNILNDTIQQFYDPILDGFPLKTVSIDYMIKPGVITYVTWNIDLSGIVSMLRATNYRIAFFDTAMSWSEFLFLDTSYNLANYPIEYSSVFDASYSDVLETTKIYKNLLTVKEGINDTITLQANSSGLIDVNGSNANDWTITVPPGDYSAQKMVDTLNQLCSVSPQWVGSRLYYRDNHIYFSVNSGKVFNTNDYKLVFYDPYSFVRCFVGASSVRNTSWDTTIGWILGFRELTEYILSPTYVTPDVNDASITYYGDTLSLYTYDTSNNIVKIVGDTTVSVNLYNYFMIVLDDYTQNHLNDGLVTITPSENNTTVSSYVNKSTVQCDPVTGKKIFTGAKVGSNNQTTANQIYAANQVLNAKVATAKLYSPGPFIQDIFALLPLNTSSLSPGSVYIDNGSGLAKQSRMYFGPVNISRMTIKLINDRGDVVDLNGSDWSCSLECDQLYQQKSL